MKTQTAAPDCTDWKTAATALAALLPAAALDAEAAARLDADSCGNNGSDGGANNSVNTPARLAVACSGGADSLAALLLVWAHFPKWRGKISVLHYDHGTRPECAGDAAFVANVAAALGEQYVAGSLARDTGASANSPVNPPATEAALRDLRLAFFRRTCRACAAPLLVEGHHLGDVAETALMRLARGAGTAGLAAPRPVQNFSGGLAVVRPLLSLAKHRILDALRQTGVPWREDASNAADAHLRNRLRHVVVPAWAAANSGAQIATAPETETLLAGVARSRRLLAEDDSALETWLDSLWPSLTQTDTRPIQFGERRSHRVAFDWAPLAGLPVALHRRALRRALLAATPTAPSLRPDRVDALVAAITARRPFAHEFHNNANATTTRLCFEPHTGKLFVETAPLPSPPPAGTGLLAAGVCLFWPTGDSPPCLLEVRRIALSPELFAEICAGKFPPTETVFLAEPANAAPAVASATPSVAPAVASAAPAVASAAVCFHVRPWCAGDTYRPLGAPGSRKLGDIFTDKKIPPFVRLRLPVVCDSATGAILWIPGLPPAHDHRLCPSDRSALRLTWQSPSPQK